ncbi:carboxyl transferase domain-containing protein [[Clostridium] symbiosum]|uniref:acyl-CoA carboxylase subunit beta n=1 Tax=Clostridium symbiosum TaxID=1512 RepID=UPI001D077E26|nr:carboxyl transferase domain-containing protein [[Clostridium] symbiosum]MCB6607802.1 carboxyl transferase [[Clostridium] symbiosum]MCB6932663.1 carboxyl transferase [[Clostridium] symbiosum]
MSNSAQTLSGKRIDSLLDDNSFVEVGSYITARSTNFNMTAQETAADGVITGYGTIEGNLVYVYSQDASVMGGSIGEMHAKKISNIYKMAMKMGAPVIGLLDCSGLRLQEATDALDGFGQMYLEQTMASGVVPQICAVFGNCGGGMAVSSAIADFVFMADNGKLFVNSPNALAGNDVTKCDTASAAFQSEETGLVDAVGSEEEILSQIRTLVSILPANNEDDMSYDECEDDLNRVSEELAGWTGDTAKALAEISDGYFFMEVKKEYDPSMVTGFIRLNGSTVGCVANRTEIYNEENEKTEEFEAALSARGCEKAAEFVNFCDAFNIPLLTLVNVKGYKQCKCTEKKIAKAAGRLTYAFANADVPKVTVVIGDAFGSAYVTMNSKSIGADIVYAWPQAKIGMMDAQSAVKIMYAEEIGKSENAAALISEKAAEYEKLQSSAQAAAGRGYVDDIIEAGETRKRVIAAFEMLFTKREDRPSKKHGTV